ncbi:glycosyltransferase family 2 protein [Kibdelosporangium persicum]|uniref:Glycosyltransferase, catalytic subunit of cellulose synthase and poly-beta-1,6-N-acetylglucosamine synthase n=1 Tax=Kibdelosporangium persicum TaxID=2698649 RepID=A0ABX2FGY1_9PSEU|nr:Glycosyltransferase, catalytic subunit of cellulose synthase and poly-beta-1,6-N-acetylglucosamine synthase [Kibdelosporangium persicum]
MTGLSIIGWVLLPPVGCIAFFQLFYLIHSFGVRTDPRPAVRTGQPTLSQRQISVVIPVFNEGRTLYRCLHSLSQSDLCSCAKVVVVLDRCTDDSELIAKSFVDTFAAAGVEMAVEHLPADTSGKVAGLLYGGSKIDTKTALLLDADIVLEPTALQELWTFHQESNADFTACLILPLQERRGTLVSHVVCNNRLYRQSVLQSVRNRFGMSNFPGGLQLVDYKKYRDLLEHGFLEDLTATYRAVSEGSQVRILPRVLAREVERQTIRGLFLQRVRWTLGTIQHIPMQVRTARSRKDWNEKISIYSYHVMWEFQYYVMVIAAMLAPWQGTVWPVFLAPYVLYVLQIVRSAVLTRNHYKNSVPGIAAHCALFPSIITTALFAAVGLLVVKRKAFFSSVLLFRRN